MRYELKLFIWQKIVVEFFNFWNVFGKSLKKGSLEFFLKILIDLGDQIEKNIYWILLRFFFNILFPGCERRQIYLKQLYMLLKLKKFIK